MAGPNPVVPTTAYHQWLGRRPPRSDHPGRLPADRSGLGAVPRAGRGQLMTTPSPAAKPTATGTLGDRCHMPVQPEGQRPPALGWNEPHQHRQVAESFGSDAERYDRARPSYPGALVQRIVAASPGADVLDVGCGTGIAARQFEAAGCRVLGVDPDARMAGGGPAEWDRGRGSQVRRLGTRRPGIRRGYRRAGLALG